MFAHAAESGRLPVTLTEPGTRGDWPGPEKVVAWLVIYECGCTEYEWCLD